MRLRQYLAGGYRRDAAPLLPPRKEQAPCCQAHALADGRPVIGFCGRLCLRRPAVWAEQRGRLTA